MKKFAIGLALIGVSVYVSCGTDSSANSAANSSENPASSAAFSSEFLDESSSSAISDPLISSSSAVNFSDSSISSSSAGNASAAAFSSSSFSVLVSSSSSVKSSSSVVFSSSSVEESSSSWAYSSGEYILGADISKFQEYEAAGYKFYDTDGEQKTIFQILRNHGFNYVRLKTFVSPTSVYGYAYNGCDVSSSYGPAAFGGKDSVIAYAKRVKEAGFGLLVDIHYSDNWADPGKQHVPYPWRNIASSTVMADSVYNYTYNLITSLKNAGATPDMVQIGNEITNGFIRHAPPSDCWGSDTVALPLSVNGGMGTSSGISNTAMYLKKGFAAVKAVSSSIITMAHIESPQNTATVEWWMNAIINQQSVSFDVMGFSAYTAYSHGTPSTWKTLISSLSGSYPKLKFVIAEYNGGSASNAYNYDGSRALTNTMMESLSSGLGSFFWEPAESGAWGKGMFTWDVSNKTLTADFEDFEEFDGVLRSVGLKRTTPGKAEWSPRSWR